jgi:Tfp pilus assembly protein PilV
MTGIPGCGTNASGGERGFSLIEAIVAAGLIAGACAALAQMLTMSIARNMSARSLSAAIIIAAEKMEQLREVPWDAAAGGVDYVDQSGRLIGSGSTVPPDALYVRRWDVAPLPSRADVLACRVVVTRGQRETARLFTLRARRSP